jgi:hypothetical protein
VNIGRNGYYNLIGQPLSILESSVVSAQCLSAYPASAFLGYIKHLFPFAFILLDPIDFADQPVNPTPGISPGSHKVYYFSIHLPLFLRHPLQ